MQRAILEDLMHRCILALRRRGEFDAANEGENWRFAWKQGTSYDPHGEVDAMGECIAEWERATRVDSPGNRVRIRFQPERAWNLDLDDHGVLRIADSVTGVDWEVRLSAGVHAEKSRALVVQSSGIPDEQRAAIAASRLECALLLVSIRSGYGFAFSERLPPMVITKAGFKLMIPDGMQGLKDDLGIIIFKTPPPTLFIQTGTPIVSVRVEPSRFADNLRQALLEAGEVSQRTRTAYELYASSRFENASRSRFLLLVMSLEAMIERGQRPKAEQDFIKAAIAELGASGLSSEAQATLKNALSSLKAQSISSAAYTILATEISQQAADDFKEMYGIRSRLVHGGEAIPPSEINDASNTLEPIVKTLLLKRLCQQPFVGDSKT